MFPLPLFLLFFFFFFLFGVCITEEVLTNRYWGSVSRMKEPTETRMTTKLSISTVRFSQCSFRTNGRQSDTSSGGISGPGFQNVLSRQRGKRKKTLAEEEEEECYDQRGSHLFFSFLFSSS